MEWNLNRENPTAVRFECKACPFVITKGGTAQAINAGHTHFKKVHRGVEPSSFTLYRSKVLANFTKTR